MSGFFCPGGMSTGRGIVFTSYFVLVRASSNAVTNDRTRNHASVAPDKSKLIEREFLPENRRQALSDLDAFRPLRCGDSVLLLERLSSTHCAPPFFTTPMVNGRTSRSPYFATRGRFGAWPAEVV
jgi:hypothetical protein